MSLDPLRKVVDAIYPLSNLEWEDFSSVWLSYSSKRKVILTTAGETEDYLYFVLEGVQRIYYLDELGREATLVFSYAPSFAGVVDSFVLRQKSKYYFETLTQCTFLRARYLDLQACMERHPAVKTMVLLGITNAFSGVLERLIELQCYSSTEKFSKLLSRSPHILQLVPHKYLANYIGVDPTNFSKLINSVKS